MAEVSDWTIPLPISDIRSFRDVVNAACPALGIVTSVAVSFPSATVSPETSAMRHEFSAALISSSTEAALGATAAAAAAESAAGAAAFAESTAARSSREEEQAATTLAETAHQTSPPGNRPFIEGLDVRGLNPCTESTGPRPGN